MWICLVSLLTALSLLLSGCASTAPTISYPYQPTSIRLFFDAPDNLNFYDKQGHALTLGVIQTDQLDPLYPFLKNQDGLVNLLMNNNNKFQLQRLFIQPNSQRTLVLDRNAKTQYLLLVAGYADLLPAQSYQIIKVPIKSTSHGFMWLKTDYAADTVYIYAQLGPQGLLSVRACNESLDPKENCGQSLLEQAPTVSSSGSGSSATS